ncbi:hypothetical protein MD484_g620, partial [Candolleomyces efflorescens]
MASDANGAVMHPEDHPVVAQLNSLKAAFDRVQDELYRNSVKLQSHYFKASNEQDRIQHLEQENKALKDELEILRQTPHPDTLPQSHPAVPQVQQLTLSLRKLSDQLSNTEDTLLQRTTELSNAKSDAVKAKLGEEKAYELAARIRGREEASRQRERELEWKLRSLEEQGKMSDIAMKEYASLVRSLEAKMGKGGAGRLSTSSSGSRNSSASGGSAPTLEASFSEGKRNLKRVMDDMHSEVASLHAKIEELQLEKEELIAKLEAQAKSCDADRLARSQAEFELDKLKVDDNTATKMVARYMYVASIYLSSIRICMLTLSLTYRKFSQLQTDTLQTTISTLKSRHAASIDSLSSQLYTLSNQLQASQASLERFQTALDELGGDIMRESFGRRNEVALRIKLVEREERVSEQLEKWVQRAAEERERSAHGDDDHGVLEGMIREAKLILASLNAPPTLPPPLLLQDEEDAVDSKATETTQVTATLGRLVIAQYLVDQLKDELQYELSCKLRLRRMVAELGGDISVDAEFLPEDIWEPPEGWMSEVPVRPPPPATITEHVPSPTNTRTAGSADAATTPTTLVTATTLTTTTAANPSSVSPATTPSAEATTTLSPKAQQAATSLLLELEELEFEANHVRALSPLLVPAPSPPAESPVTTGDVKENASLAAGNGGAGQHEDENGHEDGDGEGVQADASTPRVGSSSLVVESTQEGTVEQDVEVKEEEEEEKEEEKDEEGGRTEEKIEAEAEQTAAAVDVAPEPSSVPPPDVDTSADSSRPVETEEEQEEGDDEDDNDDVGGKAIVEASAGVLTPLAKSIPLVSISQPDSFNDMIPVPHSAPAVLNPSRGAPPPSQPEAAVVDSVLATTSESSSTPTPVFVSTSETTEQETTQSKSTPFTHPLLPKLAETAHRYDNLQRSFKDCHLSLQSLKSSITAPTKAQPNVIPKEILEAILERLNDFVEDARVELEIRKSDEAVLCKGYETLLSVPGALEGYSSALPGSASSSSGGFGLGLMSPPGSASGSLSASVSSFFKPLRSAPPGMFRSQTPTNGNGKAGMGGLGEVEDQIQAFIDGTEPSIVKAMEGFRRKLGDAEHDIAALKKAVHQALDVPPPSTRVWAVISYPPVSWYYHFHVINFELFIFVVLVAQKSSCQRLLFVPCTVIASTATATATTTVAEFDLRKRDDEPSAEAFTLFRKYAEETSQSSRPP